MTTRTERTPESFKSAQLLAMDFDGTVAMTFEKPTRGIGVEKAYEEAVAAHFGTKGLEQYIRDGGLRNRAAPQVVQELAPDATIDEQARLTSSIIEAKLQILTDQIGSPLADGGSWPRPSAGYLQMHQSLERARSDGRSIDDLIISSGHDPFIRKTYQMWGIQAPDYIIAEEITRALAQTTPIEQLVKPSTRLMEVGHTMWRRDYGVESAELSNCGDRGRIIFVGDDPEKDGMLARNSGVNFFLLDNSESPRVWQLVAMRLNLGRVGLRGGRQSA